MNKANLLFARIEGDLAELADLVGPGARPGVECLLRMVRALEQRIERNARIERLGQNLVLDREEWRERRLGGLADD